MATKAKMEALEKMVDVIAKYGEIETMIKMSELQSFDAVQAAHEDVERVDAKRSALANDFKISILGDSKQKMGGDPNLAQQQPAMAQQMVG